MKLPQKIVLTLTNDLPNVYLDRTGSLQMPANLQMDNNIITGLTNQPIYFTEAANKSYVDNAIPKGNIKPSHTVKNVFQHLMNDVDEWSTEHSVIVLQTDDLNISPHYWDKKCLCVSTIERLNSYMWIVGLQCFRLATNQTYTLVIELYNKELLAYNKTDIYITGAGMWIEGHNTKRSQYQYSARKIPLLNKDIGSIQKDKWKCACFCVFYCTL